jgi:hypothetical protein
MYFIFYPLVRNLYAKGNALEAGGIFELPVIEHLPINGSTLEVGGIFSATSIMKTVIDSNVVIPMVTFSPESDGI